MPDPNQNTPGQAPGLGQPGIPPINGNVPNANSADVNGARRGAGTQTHANDVNTVLGVYQRNPQAFLDALVQIYKQDSAVIDRALGRNPLPSTSNPGNGLPSGGAPVGNGVPGASPSQQGFTYLDHNQQMVLAQSQIAAISSVAMDPNAPADKKTTAQGFMTWYSGEGNAQSWHARMSNAFDPSAKLSADEQRRQKDLLDRELFSKAGATVGELGIVMGGIPNYQPQMQQTNPNPTPTMQQPMNNGGMNMGMGGAGQQVSPDQAYGMLPQIQQGNQMAITQYGMMFSQLVQNGMDQRQAGAMIQRLLDAQTQQNYLMVQQQARIMAQQAQIRMQVEGQLILLYGRSNIKIGEARAMSQIRTEERRAVMEDGLFTAAAVGVATGRLSPIQGGLLGLFPSILRWGKRQAGF